MGAAARARIEELCSWETVAPQVLETYRRAVR
jgi:hypothetical protein